MSHRGLLPHVVFTTTSMPPCVACLQGVADFHTAAERIGQRATRALDRLFIDFFVAGGKPGYDNTQVVLYVLDYATRYLWVHNAPTRTACVTWFLANLSRFERQASSTIGELISDNGPEFLSNHFRDVLMTRGIEHTFSVPSRPPHCRLASGLLRSDTACTYSTAYLMPHLITVIRRTRQ